MHYSIQTIEDIKQLKEILENGPNSLNLLFIGTSGVHGTYTKPWELLNDPEYKDSWDKNETTYITVLLFHPRLVCLRYGEIKVDREDLKWLWKTANKSVEIIQEDHFKEIPVKSK